VQATDYSENDSTGPRRPGCSRRQRHDPDGVGLARGGNSARPRRRRTLTGEGEDKTAHEPETGRELEVGDDAVDTDTAPIFTSSTLIATGLVAAPYTSANDVPVGAGTELYYRLSGVNCAGVEGPC